MFAAAGGGVMLVGTACSKGEVQVCNTLQDIAIHCNALQYCMPSGLPSRLRSVFSAYCK